MASTSAAPEESPERRIPVFSAVHPSIEATFNETAMPKNLLREARSKVVVACAKCSTLSSDNSASSMQRCSRCKMVWYCSRECQKDDWPTHKKLCKSSSPATSAIPKILTALVANDLLNHFLQLTFILEFGLDKNPSPNKPLIAQCAVELEPADTAFLMKLVVGQLNEEEKGTATGMLQIRTFEPRELPLELSASADESTSVDQHKIEIWKNLKSQPGCAGKHIGLVDFVQKKNPSAPRITKAIVIEQDSFNRIKAGVGYKVESAMMPIAKDVKLSRQSCLDFINMHIRYDKRNQLRLRTEMNREDIRKLQEFDDEPEAAVKAVEGQEGEVE